MKNWTKTAGLLFMAAASVYSDRAIAAKPGKAESAATPATDVKVIEATDPFAGVSAVAEAPTTGPATAPSESSTPIVSATENTAPAAPAVPNADGTFSLNITAGADVVEQLRVIGFQAQQSIIPSKEVHGTLPAMDLYNVTVHEALDAMLHANGYAWRENGKFIFVYSAKEIAQMEQAARVATTEVFRVYYTPAANAAVMIKPVLSADGQVAVTTPAVSGIATGTGDVGGNSHSSDDILIVTDYAENLDRVRAVLKEIDRRPQQILVEATILRASLNEDNSLGIDFNIIGGVDFNGLTAQNGQFGAAQIPAGGSGTFPFTTPAHSVGTGNSFSGPITNGLKVGIVTNNVSVFLSALEGVTDTTVLANPKILALNKQKGEVIVGREDGYLTTTVTESTSTQTVEFLKTGTRLIFRPYIGDDGYIRMEVHPEDSSGGLQTAANLPFKTTTEVTSNIMVKDGHTIVIGGLFRESASSTRSQIPVLGNMPLVGPLFRQQVDATRREEVIILLTPHIVKDDNAYSDLSKEQLANAEKLRVGVRKGMMFWGRSRLAEMNYEQAVAEMNKSHPDRKKALWHLDAATNLNPKYIEAINLKQELTGKEITMSSGSSIRSFVRDAMLVDRAPATQPSVSADSAAKVAAAPTSQPVAAIPTSQPVAAVPATQPAVVEAFEADDALTGMVADDELAAAPATAPSTQPVAAYDADEAAQPEATSEQMTVTELPVDEVPSSGLDDANK
jgi:type IV pilus assembly protein PilQ